MKLRMSCKRVSLFLLIKVDLSSKARREFLMSDDWITVGRPLIKVRASVTRLKPALSSITPSLGYLTSLMRQSSDSWYIFTVLMASS